MPEAVRVFAETGSFAAAGSVHASILETCFLDGGLVNAACGIDRLTPEQVADARFVNEGAMAEQFIAQHLPLLASDEVKAGKSGSLKSLLELVAARGYERALRFDTNPSLMQRVTHSRSHDAVAAALLGRADDPAPAGPRRRRSTMTTNCDLQYQSNQAYF